MFRCVEKSVLSIGHNAQRRRETSGVQTVLDLFVGIAEVFNQFCFGLKQLPQIQIVLCKLFLPCVDESFVIKMFCFSVVVQMFGNTGPHQV